MTLEQLYALTSAGFTKSDILSMIAPPQTPAPAPAPASGQVAGQGTVPMPAPAPAPAPALNGAGFNQNLFNPVDAKQEQLWQAGMQAGGQQVNFNALNNSIDNLTRAVQANGILNTNINSNPQPTVDDMLAEIISPTKNRGV